jgi:hypothetical protein
LTNFHQDIHEVSEKNFKEYIESMCKDIFNQGNFLYLSKPKAVNYYDGILYIGNRENETANEVNAYSDGWNVHINKEVSLSFLENSIGANVAACFGVAELLKKL